MGFFKEFREFALRGNVLDLAVGVIIGGAFGGIVNSMINDLIMPMVGKVVGNVDFTNLYVPLNEKVTAARDKALAAHEPFGLVQAKAAGPVFAYGNFITIILNFVILAFCIFLVVKAFNEAKKRFEKEKVAAPPAGPTPDQKLLTEIRDILRAK